MNSTHIQEHLAAATATGFSLVLPIDVEHWLWHVATSVFVGVLTWVATHFIKFIGKQLKGTSDK